MTIRSSPYVAALGLLLLVTTSCAAPGSSLTRVRVKGRVTTLDGAAAQNERIGLRLPAGYGLAGLDARWGEPAMYGHVDQDTVVTTDANGQFEVLFRPVTYSIMFFFLPPLGARPRYPPAPHLVVGFVDRLPNMGYLMAFTGGEFGYRVINFSAGEYETEILGGDEGPVWAVLQKEDFPTEWQPDVEMRGWTVVLELRLPDR
jgi:hypothetical protein